MHIFVTGACGYKGSVLVPKLLAAGHSVVAFDIMWFGNALGSHERLTVLEGDVRDIGRIDLNDSDAVIHLASVANDPCSDLEPLLTWEISCLATMQLADRAVRHGVRHFIYASSGSVYGLKAEEEVTEDLDLVPLSAYNKTKMVGERVLLSYADRMIVQIVRPATVCGLSPRMRLDVAVNLLTMQALSRGEISVLGGDQTLPNIHIEDITDVYLHLLARPDLRGIFNAGFENLSILKIAQLAAAHTGARIVQHPSNDPRSYRVNSAKLLGTGFTPRKTVNDAIREIGVAWRDGALRDDDRSYNLKWMQQKAAR
jgi:nucleoside-diphosphate-sugar epimerase